MTIAALSRISSDISCRHEMRGLVLRSRRHPMRHLTGLVRHDAHRATSMKDHQVDGDSHLSMRRRAGDSPPVPDQRCGERDSVAGLDPASKSRPRRSPRGPHVRPTWRRRDRVESVVVGPRRQIASQFNPDSFDDAGDASGERSGSTWRPTFLMPSRSAFEGLRRPSAWSACRHGSDVRAASCRAGSADTSPDV